MSAKTGNELRYKKPKVLLIDLPESARTALVSGGYNAQEGTFGRAYKVPPAKQGRQTQWHPLLGACDLPNVTEQEVVVIDLRGPKLLDSPQGMQLHTQAGDPLYGIPFLDVIDPRPWLMASQRSTFDRILHNGGVFVVFAAAQTEATTIVGRRRPNGYVDIDGRKGTPQNSWSFLSLLSDGRELRVGRDHGTEIEMVRDERIPSCLLPFLRTHFSNASFEATLSGMHPSLLRGQLPPSAIPLGASKFGEPVSVLIRTSSRQENGEAREGIVLVIPQFRDKKAAVLDLVRTVLPELVPQLFPEHEGARWVHRPEYEHPAVLEYRTTQEEVRRGAQEEINQLETQITAERERLAFLHGLLTGHGDPLVADVKRALEFIGFKDVRNMDEVNRGAAKKEEDLQIHDTRPVLLVEVKGVTGQPREDDTLQVAKYLARRMKDFGHTDVAGLCLVNHQRNLPPRERDNANAFTAAQVGDAEASDTGLMTTWDLFQLIRGMAKWGWPKDVVRQVLYGKGRLPHYPLHYTPVGTVGHYYTDKGVIRVEADGEPFGVGDTLAYLLSDGIVEEVVSSLQVDKKPFQRATAPGPVGVQTTLTRGEIPVGTRIFRVGPAGAVSQTG